MKNFIISIVIIGLLLFGGYYFYMYQELVNEQEEVHLYNQSIVNGEAVESNDIIVDDHGRLMISVAAIQTGIDSDVYLSGSKSRIYVPLLGKTLRLETSKLTQFVRQHVESINIPIIQKDDKRYVEFDVIQALYGLTIKQYPSYNSFVVDNRTLSADKNISGKVKLFGKTDEGMKSMGKFKTTSLVVLNEDSGYSQVLTDNGEIAYVKKETLEATDKINFFVDEPLNKARINNNLPNNFTVSWHQLSRFSKISDIGPQETLPIDVISPTWFALNVEGIVINEASRDYVNKAHDKGYDVWGLYSNSFKPEWTKDLFASDDYSKQSIAQLLIYSALYDLDGINFDFENMYIGNKADFVTYIAQATEQLQYQNLRTSIDVTVPWGSDQWSKVYDRVELSKLVDYMCLMAYDEFWAASKKAGPVASMEWVERGITESLKLIPREKLVLSLPLYMRTWAIQGNGNAKSKSMSWKTATALIEEFGSDVVYDASSGQNFLAYKKEGSNYRVWLEDAFSMKKRIEMANSYDLPGIALWSKGFATEETWKIIEDVR